MKKHRYLYAIIAVFFGILACASPSGDSAPRLAGTVEVEGGTPISRVDAKEAIQTYAMEVLGLNIPNLQAGGRSGEINLPINTPEGFDVILDMAGTTYFGFWNQGFASLSIGDSTITGNWKADVEGGTIGIYAVRQDQDVPTNAEMALNQVITTFPGLSGYEFIESSIEEFDIQGFSFAATQVEDINMESWEATLTGTTIRAGVAPGLLGSKSLAWVFVGSGALGSPFR